MGPISRPATTWCLYISGDSEDTPEMRAFHAGIIYPDHFRNQNTTFTDLNSFKQQLMTNPVVEVRLRKWY